MNVINKIVNFDSSYKKVEILYLDDFVAVIYKPSGLLSVPSQNHKGRSAIEILENFMRKNGRASSSHRPAAVHRLDRDTSGVMMFALTKQIQKQVMENWKKIVTKRTYRAISENHSKIENFKNEGKIDAPLCQNSWHITYVPKPDDKNFSKSVNAVTNYKVIKSGKKFTLFELNLETGRKNQIRAHLSYKGFPISGDENYRAKTNVIGRLALHARILEFIHPVTKQKLYFEVPEGDFWESKIK